MLRALLVTFALANTLCAEQTLYELLNVEQDATSAQIRAAYRKLALELHPDKAKGETGWVDSTARFIKVSEAYEVLSSAKKRAEYDAKLKANRWFGSSRRGGGGGSGSGFGEDEASFFKFTYSLKDACAVLERFIDGNDALQPLATPYRVLKASLHAWEGFNMPLPQLLASDLLAKAFQRVDWIALGNLAGRAIKANFENEDGSIQWGKVAATGAIAATTLAAAMDAADDGNRTSKLLDVGTKLLKWWAGTAGDADANAHGGEL